MSNRPPTPCHGAANPENSMKNKRTPRVSSGPSPWVKRAHARLKRVVIEQVARLERRVFKGRGPKPWRDKKHKAKPGPQ